MKDLINYLIGFISGYWLYWYKVTLDKERKQRERKGDINETK